MEVFAKGRDNKFDAKGVYEKEKFIVLKGSRISSQESSNLYSKIKKLRADKNTVSPEMILRTDVTFRSASSAANFVAGYITNGLKFWKNSSGDYLGDVIKNS